LLRTQKAAYAVTTCCHCQRAVSIVREWQPSTAGGDASRQYKERQRLAENLQIQTPYLRNRNRTKYYIQVAGKMSCYIMTEKGVSS
jgi:glutaredoxin